jgi:hypothetical protein
MPKQGQDDERGVIDRVAEGVKKRRETKRSDAGEKSPTTETGLPVEDQVRKEWDQKKDGGLPTPLK